LVDTKFLLIVASTDQFRLSFYLILVLCILFNIETFLGGLGHIDIDDWKSHTRLKHCNPETQVVKWFWDILDEYSEEMRARLLQFVTGSSRVIFSVFRYCITTKNLFCSNQFSSNDGGKNVWPCWFIISFVAKSVTKEVFNTRAV